MFGDAFTRHISHDHIVPLWPQRDYADVGGVALVTRPGVRDVNKLHSHSTTSTDVATTDLSINAGQYATISSTFGRPPGLADTPFGNGRPRVMLIFAVLSGNLLAAQDYLAPVDDSSVLTLRRPFA